MNRSFPCREGERRPSRENKELGLCLLSQSLPTAVSCLGDRYTQKYWFTLFTRCPGEVGPRQLACLGWSPPALNSLIHIPTCRRHVVVYVCCDAKTVRKHCPRWQTGNKGWQVWSNCKSTLECLTVSSDSVMAARNGERRIIRKEKREAATDHVFGYIQCLTI